MKEQEFVLAVYPATRGYGFVLFEDVESPFDWGVVDVRGASKNDQVVEGVSKLIYRYHPQVLVLENIQKRCARRFTRTCRLSRALVGLACASYTDVKFYSRSQIRQCFASVGARTKFEIAQAIVLQIPAFEHRLPPLRKIWMSEDLRQSLFDAAALGITYYNSQGTDRAAIGIADLYSPSPRTFFTHHGHTRRTHQAKRDPGPGNIRDADRGQDGGHRKGAGHHG